jgi:hypothetical protein
MVRNVQGSGRGLICDWPNNSWSRDRVLGVSTKVQAGRPGTRVSIPDRSKSFCLFELQTGSGYPELPVQWVLGSLSPRVKRPGLKSTSYIHLMPSLHACRDLNGDLFSSKDGCSPIEL